MRITGDNAMQMYAYSIVLDNAMQMYAYSIVLYCIVLLFFSRVTFRDKTNQSVLSRLVHEVKALNHFFLTQHIKGNF